MAQMESPQQYGWICPKCGAVMSPWFHTCVNCLGSTSTNITSCASTSPFDQKEEMEYERLEETETALAAERPQNIWSLFVQRGWSD